MKVNSSVVMRAGIFLLMLTTYNLVAQENDPLNKPINREILGHYEKRADEFAARNLNRFALDRLQAYDRVLDSLYIREKEDTIKSISSEYQTRFSNRIAEIDKLQTEIKSLESNKAELKGTYSSLIRKAILSFSVWMIVIVILLQARKRRMKKSEKNLDLATQQLLSLENSASTATKLFNDLKEHKNFKTLKAELDNLSSQSNGSGIKNQPAGWPDFLARTDALLKRAVPEGNIIETIISQNDELQEEKEMVDINTLCESCLEIVSRGFMKTETFNYQVSRDFEKKLPLININVPAVNSLLLNVLKNAFESVKEKNEKGTKGYQPKITMSTRILPKFLQVRVRDNGLGMDETSLGSADKEFYSRKIEGNNSGLGLSMSKKMISEIHKGEIKIESEDGNSTDVYIKFYI